MHSAVFFMAALALSTGVAAHGDSFDGYRVETMQWNIEVAPGQFELLNGTIEEALEQAMELHPRFQPVIPLRDVVEPETKRALQQKRSQVLCGTGDAIQGWGYIRGGIKYLRTLTSAPKHGPGPGACGRVSCSHDSGIWWCNNTPNTKVLDGWDRIANSAQHIVNTCDVPGSSFSGENREDDGWTTIIRQASC